MRSAGKTTRKHRRQQANGKPRHKLIGGRTGGKATHQLKNFKRGKAAKVVGRARNETVCSHGNPSTASARSFRHGRAVQWWGFYTPAGKVHWQDYLRAQGLL